ncbi:MAG: ubiquinol-cytochrome C chaperone [Alphaproteobacteria bacterium]|nr:MAG: ubiquinol-cytochrome C chaperone [Alphaproteobacteria bacterium]
MRLADHLKTLIRNCRARGARKARAGRLAKELHAAAISASRDPVFYREFGVPDTFDGRFDLLLLNMFLLAERLEGEVEKTRDARRVLQLVQEAMFDDFDRLLREMGVGDMSVGRHIRNMARAWAGRVNAYRTALHGERRTEGETALSEALLRNLWRCPKPADISEDEYQAAHRLARHALSVRDRLTDLPFDRLNEAAAVLRPAGGQTETGQ